MGSKGEPAGVDTIKQFAEALRSKGGIENRSGVLQGERFELFRGKDLVRWVKANPEKCAAAGGVKGGEGEELAKYLGQQLIRRRLALRVDRLNKKPLPGSKRMVKFPRKLVPLPPEQANAFAEDGFYVWLCECPTSLWTYVWTALIPLGVLGACLFPLAPNWAKVAVFYLSSGLLILILGLLLLRGTLAAVTWIVSGRTLWLLPNLLSEELPITQIFKPLLSVQHPAENASKWSSHPLTRVAVGAALGGFLYVLYSHSPNAASIGNEATRYRDDLMDWLGVQREGYQRLSNNSSAAVNATDAAAANATAAGEEAGGAGAAAEAATEPAAEAEAAAEAAGDAAAEPEAAAESEAGDAGAEL